MVSVNGYPMRIVRVDDRPWLNAPEDAMLDSDRPFERWHFRRR